MTSPTVSAGQRGRDSSRYVYDAFISYNHAVDRVSAKALQRILHRLGRPWYRRAALRVFRDDTTLAASASLKDSIRQALLGSKTFVLFACPESASSTWVQQEIRIWRDERSTTSFFIVLTDGSLAWDSASGDFDWDRTTALPRQQMSGWFIQEPLWVDLRNNRDQRERREFRSAAATVAAAIHDVPKDNLLSEDARQQRRLVSVLSVLLVLVLVGGALAVWQRDVATAQRDRADQQARTALSRALAAEAQVNDTADPRLAAQLAVAAYGVARTSQATGAVLHELDRNRHVLAYVRRGTDQTSTQGGVSSPPQAHVSVAGPLLAYADETDSVVTLWNTRTHRRVRVFRTPSSGRPGYTPSYGLAISRNGRTVVADDGSDFQVWDVPSGRSRTIKGAGGGHALTVSSDGRFVARVAARERDEAPIRLWRTDTGAETSVPPNTTDVADTDLAFDPAGDRLYAEHRDGIDVLDLATMTWSNVVPLTADHPEKFALDPSGTRLVVATGSGVELWDVRQGKEVAAVRTAAANDATAIGVSDAARTVVAGNDAGQVVTVDLGTGATTELTAQRAAIQDLAVTADGSTVATISANGDVIVSSPDVDHRLRDIFGSRATGLPDRETAVAISRHGGIAVAGHVTASEIWSVDGHRVEAPGVDFDPSGVPAGVAVDANGTEVAELSDGVVTLVDARSGAVLGRAVVPHVRATIEGSASVRFLPDGRRVIVDSDDGPEIIDPRTGRQGQEFRADGGGFGTNTDGSVIAVVTRSLSAVAGGSTIQEWRSRGDSYDLVTEFTVSGEVRNVAVDRDGSRIAAADVDGRVIVTDVSDDNRQQVLNSGRASSHSRIAFTADGSVLVQDDQQLGGLALWGVNDGQLLTTWLTNIGNEPNTTDNVELATDDDGRAVAAQPDGTVLVWQPGVGRALSSLCGIAGQLSGPDVTRYLQGVDVPSDCP